MGIQIGDGHTRQAPLLIATQAMSGTKLLVLIQKHAPRTV